ncbi:hypothetical protein CUJ84_pRLN3000464 (plasmid) [Rhizobium leguminosarum]|uniref:Uncharacterized protein n=1 Tax=Rhizobium leguminosarum TaxID=384 RepID=A0A2K9ZH37_RHILE|nr:hypothetical protein CUJ84_pRLN3000464 [Rhizobium leguminosarum]
MTFWDKLAWFIVLNTYYALSHIVKAPWEEKYGTFNDRDPWWWTCWALHRNSFAASAAAGQGSDQRTKSTGSDFRFRCCFFRSGAGFPEGGRSRNA